MTLIDRYVEKVTQETEKARRGWLTYSELSAIMEISPSSLKGYIEEMNITITKRRGKRRTGEARITIQNAEAIIRFAFIEE